MRTGGSVAAEARRELEIELIRAIASAQDLDEATCRILQGVCHKLDWDFGALWALDDSGTRLRMTRPWHVADSETLARFAEQMGEIEFEKGLGIPGVVWDTGEPVWIEDVTRHPLYLRAEMAVEVGLRSSFCFPIFARGDFYGVMEFFSHEIEEPDESLMSMLGSIGFQLGSFIERDRMQRELWFQKTLLESQGESSLDGIGVMSNQGQVVYWNQRLLEMFDLEEHEVRSGDVASLIPRMIERTARPEDMRELVEQILADPEGSHRVDAEMSDGRIVDAWTAPVRGPDGEVFGRVVYCRDVTESRRAAEESRKHEEWTQFLAEATALLSESLDIETVLNRLAELAVPTLADWCAVHLLDDEGLLQPLAVAHTDPGKVRLARLMQEKYPADPRVEVGNYGVIRSRTPLLMSEIPEELVLETAQDEEHLQLIRSLELRSAMIVPFVARGEALGTFSLIASESGRRFTQEDLSRLEELATRASFPIDNARLYDQARQVSRTLQNSFLPPDLPAIPGAEISARYLPSSKLLEIGGDFYDAFRVDENRWGLALGDVSGKGLEAATVTSLARHTIRGAALTAQRPSEVLNVLNSALLEEERTDRFCTAVYGIVEPRFGRIRVTLSCGGHPPPYVLRNDGRVEPVPAGGTLLGFIEGVALQDRTVDLEFGDKIIFYTDGLLDIRTETGILGQEDLEALLRDCLTRGAHATAEHIEQSVARLRGSTGQQDDLALVVVGVRSSIFNLRNRNLRSIVKRVSPRRRS